MDGVADLLAEAEHAGLSMRVEAGRLVVRGPKSAAALAGRLLARKPEVVAALVAPAPACPSCRRPLDDKARCWKCCDRLCAAGCGRQTGSAFLALCLPCEATRREGA